MRGGTGIGIVFVVGYVAGCHLVGSYSSTVVDDGGSVRLSIDGKLVASRANVDTLPAGGYTEIGAGLPWTNGGNPPAEVWVDELIVATEPIPCD